MVTAAFLLLALYSWYKLNRASFMLVTIFAIGSIIMGCIGLSGKVIFFVWGMLVGWIALEAIIHEKAE